MAKYRERLPQLEDQVLLTDGGIETTRIFHQGIDLPEFAAFVLLADSAKREALQTYFRPYAQMAADAGVGFVLEAPTWRANPDWGQRLGYSAEELAAANRAAIDYMVELREEYERPGAPFVISGCIGPRHDAYQPSVLMSAGEAQEYHAQQIGAFAPTEADLVSALTMTYSDEPIGLVRAAAEAGIPSVIAFTVETDGKLPSGEPLGAAIRTVDEATDAGPAHYMINCAHPTHFESTLVEGADWTSRIRGIRANASKMSHAELDEAEELDAGDPADLAARYADLRTNFGHLTVLGGCCGTDIRHIDAIRQACMVG